VADLRRVLAPEEGLKEIKPWERDLLVIECRELEADVQVEAELM
jgi:hypothetical protein